MLENKYINKYVYLITNLLSMRQYVGSRIKSNGLPLEDINYMGSSKYLNLDIKMFGKENFKKEIVEIVNDDCSYEYLLDRESFYIEKFNTLEPNGYNRFIPNQKSRFNMVGISFIDLWKVRYDPEIYDIKIKEFKEKQSINGKKLVGEKNGMYGKHHTNESINKNRNNQPYLNKHIPQWLKDKISKGMSGENNPFFGKTHSDKTKQQIREKQTNKKYSKETNLKKSNPKYGNSNGMYGKCWIHNYNENKIIIKSELEFWLQNGWNKEMIQNKNKV